MKVRDAIKLLERDGWFFKNLTGSHRHFIHPVKTGKVTIAGHSSDEVPEGTLLSRYAVVFEKSNTGYGAYVPDLPGCVAVGRSLEETKRLIHEAMEIHLASMLEDGDPIPEPSLIEYVEA
jgi:predicted RNase H-like HicB family nuclease/predicted RNA binding protein YcfA (HicA-like mRNA interferase family)